jgi:hypothetical protein
MHGGGGLRSEPHGSCVATLVRHAARRKDVRRMLTQRHLQQLDEVRRLVRTALCAFDAHRWRGADNLDRRRPLAQAPTAFYYCCDLTTCATEMRSVWLHVVGMHSSACCVRVVAVLA